MADGLGDGVDEGLADEGEVRGDAVAEGAGALVLEVGDGEAEEVGEDVAAEVV